MASGPEHYREAEKLLSEAQHDLFELADSDRERMIAGAQVHATLALAAATALNDFDGGMHADDLSEWGNTVSTRKPVGAA